MKHSLLMLTMLMCSAFFAGCPNTNPVTTDTSSLKGFIYYSSVNKVFRTQLSNQSGTELFSNASYPEVTARGSIIVVEPSPVLRVLYSDETGANREPLITSEGYSGPEYKEYLSKPRISYNQRYVAYEGDYIKNQHSYIIDATTGSLVATIGDAKSGQPMLSPSWAPDGSIVVAGYESTNNGIYKMSPDFSSIKRIDPNLSNVSGPSVSPDGKTIAFIRDSKVWTMGIDGSNPTQLYISTLKFSMLTWSPDSRYIAGMSGGAIYIFDIAERTATKIKTAYYIGDWNQMCWVY